MKHEAIIGLEIHAELETQSKMFCSCPVVDVTSAAPNTAVCPICAGMPGSLPVLNKRAVELGIKVGLALNCEISQLSIFERKNYFYPDLPKGFQISQYEQPLARNGSILIRTSLGEKRVRIRRVHLEEDTGKLTHSEDGQDSYSLVDLNRAGIPLLEIVSEPDLNSAEEVRAYAASLRSILRYLGVNSGDMQKGVLRIEPNISVRTVGCQTLGTRTEIKNLNSFRALERSVDFEIDRQTTLLTNGESVCQETRGWDDARSETYTQRVKEEADDYRYFPEPDLPPLQIDQHWLQEIQQEMVELPAQKAARFQRDYLLGDYDAAVLTEDQATADFFEQVAAKAPGLPPKLITNWISGDLFNLLNQAQTGIDQMRFGPEQLAELLSMVSTDAINQTSAKIVLAEMFSSGQPPAEIVEKRSLLQISNEDILKEIAVQVLIENPDQVSAYKNGKETLRGWFFGQVMRRSEGRANPRVVEKILQEILTGKEM